MMPSRENHRGNDHAGKRTIAPYKATLALETMLGKQTGPAGREYGTYPSDSDVQILKSFPWERKGT